MYHDFIPSLPKLQFSRIQLFSHTLITNYLIESAVFRFPENGNSGIQ